MSLTLLVDTMVSEGQHYSLDQRNLRDLSIKMCILSFKYVSRPSLWSKVFPDAFVDWTLVRQDLNTLGDLHLWLPLMDLFSWDNLQRVEQLYPPLASLRKAMRHASLDVGTWNLPCQLFILHMLHGIPSLQAFQMMTCRTLKRDTHSQCALLLASLSDNLHTPEACESTLAYLLGSCLQIDSALLESHLRASKSKRDDLATALRQKNMGSHLGRPRLRDKATPTEDQKVRLDSAHGTWESYIGFCQLHQFPNVLSETVKSRLYFLASQTTWDWRSHISTVTRHDGDICERVSQYPISIPDLRVLYKCIEGLFMDGTPPFQELIDFKNKCFRSFPVSTFQRMNLTQFLRLYVCAYQPHAHWKELWKMQLCLISPQIIKDCEAFVASNSFAAEPFICLLCGH